MREQLIDIWDLYAMGKIICIPANGSVRVDGLAVMGRGVALQAAMRYPDIRVRWGSLLMTYGNRVSFLRKNMLAFPTKERWSLSSSLKLIEYSLRELEWMRKKCGWDECFLPRPGCGNGRLAWHQVKLLCEDFGDWLVVIDRLERREGGSEGDQDQAGQDSGESGVSRASHTMASGRDRAAVGEGEYSL